MRRICLAAVGTSLVAMLLLTLPACEGSPFAAARERSAVPAVGHVDAPTKILFIGNSFTYFNQGIDFHLGELAASATPPVVLEIASRTTPNQTLMGHYQDESTHEALAQRQWDVVVLQGASYETIDPEDRDRFVAFAGQLDAKIASTGARTALFMTWPFRFRPGMAAIIADTYTRTGNELGALVVPAGLAWGAAQAMDESVGLYSDLRHPSLQGTYLATCVFYAALTGESPVGLPYTGGLEADEAQLLQRAAWETVESFYRPRAVVPGDHANQ
jgi:hypothetical protein